MMGFSRAPFRAPSPPRVRTFVFAVGQRAYVAGSGDGLARVTLTDDAGKIALASLGDGAEVAILAWRPGVAGNTRYRLRATDTEAEGWLAVCELRGTKIALPPVLGAPTPQTTSSVPLRVNDHPGHRFGQRRE